MVLTCFCPWTLNLYTAIVLLRLRVHYSVEIKRYKSQIRIRIRIKYKEMLDFKVTFILMRHRETDPSSQNLQLLLIYPYT